MSTYELPLRKVLITYVLTSFSIAYLLDTPLITGYLPRTYFPLIATVRMWAPFTAVITSLWVCGVPIRGGLKYVGVRLGRLKYVPLALSIPYVIYLLGASICYLGGLEPTNPLLAITKELGKSAVIASALIKANPLGFLALQLVMSGVAGVTINAVVALGEEVGWRGLMYSVLRPKYGLVPSALVTGVAWGLWHAPLIIFLKYGLPHHPDALGVAMYTAVVSVWSLIMYVLREASGSVVPPAVMHGTLNALGNLMLFTYPGIDEVYTIPLGLASLVASVLVATALLIIRSALMSR